jgi:hypothetical protein
MVFPTPGPGRSNVYVEYILDASGSMNETLPDGSAKLALAKRVLTDHLLAFRPETNIGLRAYGHRVDYRQKAESCVDIELIAPVEKGQLPIIVNWLRGFQALGMTPLAESIRQATDDFVFEADRLNSIIMLSDGIETCDGDPCGLVRELQAQGINFSIHVIGLDVDQPTRDQLLCIADTSGGTYHDAQSEQELRLALQSVGDKVTQFETVSLPATSTPVSTQAAETDVAPAPTATLASTLVPSATPAPPTETPTPTVPPRVLPEPIQYKLAGTHLCRGVTTEFGEEYRASFDETVQETNTCQERGARGKNKVEVECVQQFSDPDWVSGDRSVSVWNIRTGRLVATEGEDQIPDGVQTGATTVSLAGQEFEVSIWEVSYRDDWESDGNPWWEEATCTYHEHTNGLTVRWICHADIFVLWEGRTVHISTCDRDIPLTETSLDL